MRRVIGFVDDDDDDGRHNNPLRIKCGTAHAWQCSEAVDADAHAAQHLHIFT